MGCGCGGSKINSNIPSLRPMTGVRNAASEPIKPCPLCKWPIRRLHQYDPKLKIVTKRTFCSNMECRYYNNYIEGT